MGNVEATIFRGADKDYKQNDMYLRVRDKTACRPELNLYIIVLSIHDVGPMNSVVVRQ